MHKPLTSRLLIFTLHTHVHVPRGLTYMSLKLTNAHPGTNRVHIHQYGISSDLAPLQAIIGNYAVPILEDRQVWGTTDDTRTAYLDTQDVARMALSALR